MKYKYEGTESVEVKQSFEAHKHDENYVITETIVIKEGTKGEIVSMGCSSTDNFENHYDVEFKIDEETIEVCLHENSIEKYLTLYY